jgi:streptomycin 3"-adenylyltransferase
MTLPIEIGPQLSDACAVIERHLGGTLRSIHVFGSAVAGGLKQHSDIDLMVSVTAPVDDSRRRALMTDLLTVSAPPGFSESQRALEVTIVFLDEVVPWRYPARREMQFGEWLREDILAGIFEPALVDHDLAILITNILQVSVSLFGPDAIQLFDSVPAADLTASFLDTIAQWEDASDWEGEEQTVVLALARIWYSAATGEIVAKDIAATWALERLPQEHRHVLKVARAAYLGEAEYGPTFHPTLMAAFVRFTKQAIGATLAANGSNPTGSKSIHTASATAASVQCP